MSKLRLSDIVLAALSGFEVAPTVTDMCERIHDTPVNVRAAYDALEAEGRAKIVRRGNGLHLVLADYPGHICVICRAEFTRGRKSKRRACSRTCWIKLGWLETKDRDARNAGIKAARSTPEQRAKSVEINNKRWSDPKQREKLSEQNRKRWADPVMKMKMSVAIQREHLTPEKRALQSRNIKARWDDPEGRKKLVDGTTRGKNTPEYKAKFSKAMKERWQDPELREKYLAATRINSAKGVAAIRGKKQSPESIARRVAATKATKARSA